MHHLAHLIKLLKEHVDVVDSLAAALGNALLTAIILEYNIGIAALLGGHTEDDGLNLIKGVIINVQISGHF